MPHLQQVLKGLLFAADFGIDGLVSAHMLYYRLRLHLHGRRGHGERLLFIEHGTNATRKVDAAFIAAHRGNTLGAP